MWGIEGATFRPFHPDRSPRHVARLTEVAGINFNERVLKYHKPLPAPSADKDLAQQRLHARALYQRPGTTGTATAFVTTHKTRRFHRNQRGFSMRLEWLVSQLQQFV